MQRRGFSRDDILSLRTLPIFLFFSDGTLSDRVSETAERFGGIAPVEDILEFIRAIPAVLLPAQGGEWR